MRVGVGEPIFAVGTLLHLYRQNKLSSFHTKTHIVQQLRNISDCLSLTSEHANLLKHGFSNDTFTINHLVNGYIRLRKIGSAHQLFDEIPDPNVVTWTSLIAGYIRSDRPTTALCLFGRMLGSTVIPNAFTLTTAINACSILADVETGNKLHALVEILGHGSDVFVCSSLIDMYGKSNHTVEARSVFNLMGHKNIVSWTSLITAYAQHAEGHKALDLFREFNTLGFDRPNDFMLASVITACSTLGKLVTGKIAHGAVIRGGHDSNNVVASAIVDMYAKCGSFSYSCKVFNKIPDPTVIPYTSMIMGAAKYGQSTIARSLFDEMVEKRVVPNDVTLLGILNACSHSGLVDEGLDYLNSMFKNHRISPDARHYTCVIDMLGRTGRLDEAYKMAISINVSPKEGALLWGSLLSNSRVHGRLDIAGIAGNWLIESNQQVAAAYVTMSNTHVLAGKWESFHEIRSEMKRKGVFKEPGCSWVEIKEMSYVFYAGDVDSCPRGTEVVNLLRELERRMKERGYVGGSKGLVFVDVEEETKEEIVSLHSERLALGFSLLCVAKGVTITVMKNLRMCRDCHEAFKLISEMVDRDIVVRDVNRFHHFKNGVCTCGDFW
ncbi:pentatricopeptide repeat-containing protein At4g15720 [Impatiens glandulifera]|uniref:pentatricopeptide repeat-containing protein At4g15720 n=1 Tax=Impatiens glandulifera TaxID=253017 RepID=UPI001FB0B00C|nr:pentatricopeptide repeat-containing protein At4g15720 [Impatiens glandulifera]